MRELRIKRLFSLLLVFISVMISLCVVLLFSKDVTAEEEVDIPVQTFLVYFDNSLGESGEYVAEGEGKVLSSSAFGVLIDMLMNEHNAGGTTDIIFGLSKEGDTVSGMLSVSNDRLIIPNTITGIINLRGRLNVADIETLFGDGSEENLDLMNHAGFIKLQGAATLNIYCEIIFGGFEVYSTIIALESSGTVNIQEGANLVISFSSLTTKRGSVFCSLKGATGDLNIYGGKLSLLRQDNDGADSMIIVSGTCDITIFDGDLYSEASLIYYATDSGGDLTILDGSLVVNRTYANGGIIIFFSSKGELNISGGILESKGLSGRAIVLSNGCGPVTISGDAEISNNSDLSTIFIYGGGNISKEDDIRPEGGYALYLQGGSISNKGTGQILGFVKPMHDTWPGIQTVRDKVKFDVNYSNYGLTYNGDPQQITASFATTMSPAFTYESLPIYELSYIDSSSNVSSSVTNAGTYTASLIQVGDSIGTVFVEFVGTQEFTVAKANGEGHLSYHGYTYGESSNPDIESDTNDGTPAFYYKVKDASDDTYTSSKPVNVGEYTLKAVYPATDNYNELVLTTDFHVSKAGGENASDYIVPTSLSGVFKLNYILSEIELPDCWAWALEDQVIHNAGTNSFLAIFTSSNENYDTVTKELNVEISKGVGICEIYLDDWTYNGAYATPDHESATNSTFEVLYKKAGESDDSYVSNRPENAGDYIVIVKYEANNNFEACQATCEFSILKADGKTFNGYQKPTKIEVAYKKDNKLDSLNLPNGWEFENPTEAVGNVGTKTVSVIFTPSNSNYDLVIETLEIKVLKSNVNATVEIEGWNKKETANQPSLVGISDESIVPVYKYSKDGVNFDLPELPTKPGVYYVKAYFEGNENYNAFETESTQFEIARKGLSGGGIAAITISSVLVAGVGGFAVYWFLLKKKTLAELLAVFKKQ